MLAFIIAPFFVALLILVFVRSLKHIKIYHFKGLKVVEYLFGLLLFGGIFCVIAGFVLPISTPLKRTFTRIGYYWFGFILYFFVALGIALLCRTFVWLFARKRGYNTIIARNFTAFFIIIFTTLMSVYGIYNAHKLRITNYEIVSEKKSSIDNLNIVLVADLHLGYNVGVKEMEDMVNKINTLNPDVVVLAGDIFDNEYEAIEDPERISKLLHNINAKYGKYVTYGNHDIQEKILMGFTFEWSKEAKAKVQADERMNKFIENSGFKLLYDSYELIEDSVYIYGRPDMSKINLGNSTRLQPEEITKNLNKEKEIICIDHEPGQLEELANAGVDLDLSGHTHNGQVWPGTITINLAWKNAYGLKEINNMTSIVTSGVGLFGPNMRTGCYAEIVNINLRFKK